MARIEKNTSRYNTTDVVDFYLDLWDEPLLLPSVNDKLIKIEPKYHLRPDKMSYDLYGTPRLWWVFAMINPNKLIDPTDDFVSGLEILIPSRERIESEIL